MSQGRQPADSIRPGDGTIEEPLPLQVVSLEASADGIVTVRVVSPAPSTLTIDDTNLTVSIDGAPADAMVRPVDVESLGVTLVIDTSQSMAGPALDAAKSAAGDFVGALPADAPISIVSFGQTAEIQQAPSINRTASMEAIESLQARGETSLYDGIATALALGGGTDRRVLVVLSDGGDTASTTTLAEAGDALAGSGAEMVAIALATGESNSAVLEQLASTVGGSVVSTDDPAALRTIYGDLAAGLSSEYEVQVDVGDRPWVTVDLTVTEPSTGRAHEWREQIVLQTAAPGQATTAVEQPPPSIEAVGAAPALAGAGLLWTGAFLSVAALYVVGAAALAMRSGESRSSFSRAGSPNDSHIRVFRDLRSGASLVVEGVLADSDTRADLAARLEQAGLRLRTGEYIIVTGLLLVVGAIVGSVIWNVFAGLLAGAVAAMLPRLVLQFLIRRRRQAFAGQLPDLLSALSNTLKVGYSLPQAINSVADDTAEPARSELKRALLEARVGGNIAESLRSAAVRTGSTDLEWVVDAVEINATVGGDLVDVLERVAETIRSRTRMKAQVNALTAEARMSALVLFLLPPGLGVIILMLNPEYFEGIWDGPGGYVLVVLASFLLGMGGMWLKRMISAVAP